MLFKKINNNISPIKHLNLFKCIKNKKNIENIMIHPIFNPLNIL